VGLRTGETIALFNSTAPFAAAKMDQVRSAAMRWSSEPGLGRNGQGCEMSVLVVAVGNRIGKARALRSARVPASVAAATRLVEVACEEGGGERRSSSSTPSPLSSSTSQRLFAAFLMGGGEGAKGLAGTRVAMVGAVAVRPVGAQAGLEVHGAATALQRWRADRIDEGVVCGGVSGLRRWRLEFGTLARFLGVLQSC
jgi:hypothetical protein